MERRDGNTFGKLIRKRRLRKGFTQAQLGDMVGVGASRICQIEGGDEPSASVLLALAITLDVSLWEVAHAYEEAYGLKIPWPLGYMGSTPILGIECEQCERLFAGLTSGSKL